MIKIVIFAQVLLYQIFNNLCWIYLLQCDKISNISWSLKVPNVDHLMIHVDSIYLFKILF